MDILQYPFDGTEILQKKRAIKKQLLAGGAGFIEKKIAIVGGSTIGEIKNILELFLLDSGIRPVFYEGGYGLFYENIVFDDGSLRDFSPDLLYIHTSVRNIRQWPSPGDALEQAKDKAESEYERFKTVWETAKKLGCPIIQNNFEYPLWRNFGHLDAVDPRGRVSYIRGLNDKMAAYAAANPGFYIHDLNYLSSLHGADSWCDPATWYGYKYACAVAHIPDLCHSVASLVKSIFGKTKKALVADLDNTLWGGVVGETGPEGLELGDETPAGMAYSAFQSYLKMLSERGILLAVASKNEEDTAKTGFERPGSPLRVEDFLCFEANWGAKTQSIATIAKTLNILTDSLVFADDNPAERQLVRRQMPEVAVVDIGQPEDSIRLVERTGWFEAVALSEDDLKRNDMYRQNAKRQQSEQVFGEYREYLESLEMTAYIAPFAPEHLERITQLINKTNQFNLTTRRYSAAEVENCMNSDEYITLSGRLVDHFGDNGITSVIIAHKVGEELEIDLWVMSCRVFKRDFEFAMFDVLMQEAQRRGMKEMTGHWIPTAKNLLVKEFYATIGFDLVQETEEERVYRREVPGDYTPMNTVIKIERTEN